MIIGHGEEQSRFLECHCEERSDEAISKKMVEIATLRSQQRIAALPSVARNDNFLMRVLRPCGALNDNGNRKKIQIKMGPGPNLKVKK
jgi:hypothetical protein